MKKFTFSIMQMAALCLLFVCACTPQSNTNSWRLYWADEFNGNELDTLAWTRIPRGTPDWQNTQNDTADYLVSVGEGRLHLWGRVNNYCPDDPAEFITGGVWTKDKQALPAGRIEVCARLDGARGAWPAFWLMGFDASKPWPHGGEIDIMERLNDDAFAYQTVHSPYTLGHEEIPHGRTGRIDDGEYNVYGVDIEKDSIIMHINGVKTMTYARIPELEAEEQFPYFWDQYLLLDMQLGGSWVGAVSAGDLPYQMEIDWVRSYVREEGNERQSLFFEGTKPIENKEYEVFVNGKAIPVYPAHGKYDGGVYYYAQFDLEGQADVRVKTAGNFKEVKVLPEKFGIKPGHKGSDEIAFKATQPFKISIEREGKRYPLILFANAPTVAPEPSEDVIVLEPGEYEGVYSLTSGQTLYMKEGAILHGGIYAEGDDITVAGRGIVTGERFEKFQGPGHYIFQAKDCHNLKLEGLTFTSPWEWSVVMLGCDGVDIDNVKLVCSNILNDDAFDICNSRNVTIRNSFARVQDDIFAVKGLSYDSIQQIENIRCENCQVWTDKANIWRIGYECDCEVMRNITAKDIDVLHYSHEFRDPGHYWANCIFWIQPSNNMMIEDCLFEDIRINAADNDAILLNAIPSYTVGPSCDPGGQPSLPNGGHYAEAGDARNIVIRNVSVTGDRSVFTGPVHIVGEDGGHTISDITFENISYFGKKTEFSK